MSNVKSRILQFQNQSSLDSFSSPGLVFGSKKESPESVRIINTSLGNNNKYKGRSDGMSQETCEEKFQQPPTTFQNLPHNTPKWTQNNDKNSFPLTNNTKNEPPRQIRENSPPQHPENSPSKLRENPSGQFHFREPPCPEIIRQSPQIIRETSQIIREVPQINRESPHIIRDIRESTPVAIPVKPPLLAKKASLTINLSSPTVKEGYPTTQSPTSGPKTKPRTPTKTMSSSIPKLTSIPSSGNLRVTRHAAGNNGRTNPIPQLNDSMSHGFGGSRTNVGSGSGKLYGAIDWKEKYEESEKKRLQLVNLASKATRDYEELRRRFQDLYNDHERLAGRFEGATSQLDSLRKASEAVYAEYYKLKKKYESENNAKSEALNRVDEYNKENRRLKRQSALMMQQIGEPGNFALEEVAEIENPDNDREILYLRNRVKELESRVVDLDSELENTKLAEFETQESIMMMTDSVNSSKGENDRLRNQVKKIDLESRRYQSNLEDTNIELENLKRKGALDQEKLNAVEAQLRKLGTEKNILQRQSLVFMADSLNDSRLSDALNQISELETALDDQKEAFEQQIFYLESRLSDTEFHEETSTIQTDAKIKALEEQVKLLRTRAEEAERKMENLSIDIENGVLNRVAAPPPPPMPAFVVNGPPPPPPPPPAFNGNNGTNTILRIKRGGGNSLSGSQNSLDGDGYGPKSLTVSATPQIDDMISQLKKGIKLRPMEKSPSRMEPEKDDATAVEEMKSILNNLKRTRRL